MPFATIPQAVEAIRAGRMVVLVDDEDRENEGDVIMAAEFADEASIAFMATRACGLICLAMDASLLDRLALPMMTSRNRSRLGTAFTVSIEASEGITTGISAADRAATVAAAISDHAGPESVVSPGHVFPLRAMDGGVLVRAGHTEGSIDLCRLAGLKPAAVICEILKSDGRMARRDDLDAFSQHHDLLMVTVADLIAYREQRESLVQLIAEAAVETAAGPARAYAYRSTVHGDQHLALVFGNRLGPGCTVDEPVRVRVHKERPLADAFGCALPRGELGINDALAAMAGNDGILLYIRGRSGDLLATQLLDRGGILHAERPVGSIGMDPRDYGIGAQILRQLGVRKMRLITASDRPITALSGFGLEVVERLNPQAQGGT
ncbi:MAG: 3,4-dihydroxy-2-butanone-4-phosphate synthase [Planctomycetota bacterium]|nr:MAG: 3,4-dihydroxy-2-butanone-4-phosphate synthase [Planctomycetota bacterium]